MKFMRSLSPYPIQAAVLLMGLKAEATGNEAQGFAQEGTELKKQPSKSVGTRR